MKKSSKKIPGIEFGRSDKQRYHSYSQDIWESKANLPVVTDKGFVGAKTGVTLLRGPRGLG